MGKCGSVSDPENVIYSGGGHVPYCRVELMPDPTPLLGGRPSIGNGVRIQALDPDGDPEGPPLLFTSWGTEQLERLLHEARTGVRPTPMTK